MKSRLLISTIGLGLGLAMAAAKDATITTLPSAKSPPAKPTPSAKGNPKPSKEAPLEKEGPPSKDQNPAVTFEKGKVRELKVNLLDESAKPVSGVTVNLYGEDRGARWPQNESPEKAPPEKEGAGKNDPWWVFKTNDSGAITVRFPVKEETWGDIAPLPGVFYLVADLPDGRRAVSMRIFHGISHDEAASDYEANEWDAEGESDWVFTNETPEVDMVLTAGHTIDGIVMTPEGKPVAGKTINAIHDLHVDSHTGAGGEVFNVKATSDAEGHFKLEHVYPVACALRVDGAWTRTRITYKTSDTTSTRWLNQPLDKLPDFGDDETVELGIVVAPQAPTYHYFGQVTDQDGKPQAGLLITAGVSAHATVEDFYDSHHFETAKTDADGKWMLEASAPYVRFFDIKKDEKSEDSLGGEGYENDLFELAAPGEYNLKIKADKSASANGKKKEKAKAK